MLLGARDDTKNGCIRDCWITPEMNQALERIYDTVFSLQESAGVTPMPNKNTSSMARQKNASRITTKLVPRAQALVLEERMLILCTGLMQVSEH